MMLWYKAWRESRVRFILCVGVLTILCMGLMFRARSGFPPAEQQNLPYSAWVWANIYGNMNPTVFVILAMTLGLGGLKRERPVGTASFTLALPVTRVQLVATRAGVGLLEVAALTLVPVLLIPTLSPLIAGQSYPEIQTLQFALLFMSWGAVAFAVGFLWSTVLGGEFTGTVLCVITPVLYRVFASTSSTIERHPSMNYANFMSGFQMPYIERWTVLLVGPLPWLSFLVLAVLAIGVISAAAGITQNQDF